MTNNDIIFATYEKNANRLKSVDENDYLACELVTYCAIHSDTLSEREIGLYTINLLLQAELDGNPNTDQIDNYIEQIFKELQ